MDDQTAPIPAVVRPGVVCEPWPENHFIGSPCTYPRGAILFRQGEPVRGLHLIEDGFVKLTRSEASGRQVLVGLRAPGWLLGASAALLGLPHPITAETVTTCTLRQLAKGDYLTLLEGNIWVSHWVQRMQARQTYEQIVLLGTLGALSPRQRLEQFLVHQIPGGSVAPVRGVVQLTLPLQQQELAQAIGVSPEHLSRLLKQLEAEGYIVRKKGRLQIPKDSVLLRRAADLAIVHG